MSSSLPTEHSRAPGGHHFPCPTVLSGFSLQRLGHRVPSPSWPPPSYLPQSTSLCRLKEERYYEEMETLLGPGPLRLEELEDLLYSPLEWEWG